jgi:putative colanic acid biosynthesis UDP-glucose lipid carrier transferase
MKCSTVESSLYYPEKLKTVYWQERPVYAKEQRGYMVLKRLLDFVIAVLMVVLVFPWLFPLLAVLIKLDSRGPVFFRQKRLGYLGMPFWCYKFRTMYVNDSSDTCRAGVNDPRVTRVGHFLRNTCLDELPQFFNVLMGDMSIVGPRPFMLKDSREFSSAIGNYRLRHLARPGITGLSQVRGYRGPAVSFESIFRRWQWDVYYVRNCGFGLDCKIMAGTVMLMIRSLFHKDKPVPLDHAVFKDTGKVGVQRIA